MNKFLELCFKCSKCLLSIVLILVLLTGLFFIYNVTSTTLQINKIKNLKIVYTYPDEMINQNEELKDIERVGASMEQYEEKVTNATQKANIYNNHIWSAIMTKISDVNPEDREDFINNIPTYYEKRKPPLVDDFVWEVSSTYPRMSEKAIRQHINNDVQIQQQINENVLELYFDRYSQQAQFKENSINKLKMVRQIQLYIILACLYLFITVLIIPILLKIEENTRK